MKRKAFTLIEVIVATAVFAFFLGSVIAAMIANAHNGPVNQRRLQAANLAREGTQLVTQIRDTAWMQGVNWASLGASIDQSAGCWGLSQGVSKALDYPSVFPGLCQFQHWRLIPGTEPPITQNSVPYTREINITDYKLFGSTKNNAKLVKVKVKWTEGGEDKFIEMKKLITDWKAI